MAAHHRRTSPQPVLRARSLPHATRRRGNSLILVTAILVLLVIIAAAFLSRTQAGRQVSSAQQQAIQREERVEPIANMVVDQIASALFPQPVDPNALTSPAGFGYRVNPADAGVRTVTSSYPRLATEPNATLFGVDRDSNGDYSPDFGYNAAPYETRAWTNWPDFWPTPDFPFGQGQLNGRLFGTNPSTIAIGDSNPLGNPGFNDTRWLRSTEPRRIDVNNDGLPDTFSHWEHLSWLATANNGLRVCKDISNIFKLKANGKLENVLESANEADFTEPFALGMPYEQWLANFPPNPVSSAADFRNRVNAWFGAPGAGASYASLYASTSALPNLFRLKDLPADVRAEVERTFADTDGDGITDAFWFAPPISVDRSVRYVVAASVVDNGGLLNANVATRFNPWNTAGLTPSDLALVGNSGSPGESVGFFDNPNNSYEGAGSINSLFTTQDVSNGLYGQAQIIYNPSGFGTAQSAVGQTFLKSLGMRFANGTPNPSMTDVEFQTAVTNEVPAIGLVEARFYSDAERLQYFKSSRNNEFGLTPFTIADELELRAFHGQNNPWTTTRFESSISPQGTFDQFLRATPIRSETNEDVFQLDLPGLLKDNRRKLTTVNGARNDLAPPSTWPSAYADPRLDYNGDHFVSDADGDLVIDPTADPVKVQLDIEAYNRQKFKLDLRRSFSDTINGVVPSAVDIRERRLVWRNDMQRLLERALVRIWFDSATTPPQPKFYQSYLGRQVDAKDLNPSDGINFTPSLADQRLAAQKTMHMAASLAANIDSYRDGPSAGLTFPTDPPTHPEFGTFVPDWVEPNSTIRYIGQERQPFFMEVYFALVYPKSRVGMNPPNPSGGAPTSNNIIAELNAKGYTVPGDEESKWKVPLPIKSAGEHFVDSTSVPGVVLAIQVGNPSDLPLNLFGFGIRVNGRTYNFPPNTVIPPTTRERPATAIVYAFAEHVKDNGSNPGETILDQSEETAAGYYDEDSWRNFLDIQPDDLAPGSVVLNASGALLPAPDANGIVVFPPATYSSPSQSPFWDTSIELIRTIPRPGGGPSSVVVLDRLENPDNPNPDPTAIESSFKEAVNRLFSDPQRYPPAQKYDLTDPDIDRWYMNGVRIKNDDYLVEYARVARPWTWDVPDRNPEAGSNVARGYSDGIIRPDELNPRYVFAFWGEARPKKGIDGDMPNLQVQDGTDLVDDSFEGDSYAFEDHPDGNGSDPGSLWITYDYTDIYGAKERDGIADRLPRRGKPTFFPCITQHQGQNNVYGNGFTFPTTLEDLFPAVSGANLAIGANIQKGQFDPFTVGDKGMKASDWERIYKPPPPGAAGNVVGITYHDALMWPFQMNIKDDDFEQIGELLNVFCWGPVIDVAAGYQLPKTVKTFSEIMLQEKETEDQPAGRGVFVNRLRITPFQDPSVPFNNLAGYAPTDGPTPILSPPLQPYGSAASTATLFSGVLPAGAIGRVAGRLDMPALPAGSTIFDAVVCDDRGWRVAATDHDVEVFRQRNAAGYTGEATPGLINLSTAMPEVLRALPHGAAIVNNDSPMHYVSETGNPLDDYYPQTQASIDAATNPATRFVDSIQRYRDKTINEFVSGTIIPPAVGPLNAPFYYDRGVSYAASNGPSMLPSFFWGSVGGGGVPTDGLAFAGLRGDRGIISIGELLLTQRVAGGTSAASWNINQSYSIEFAGLDPYKLGGNGEPQVGSYDRLSTPRLATDRSQGRDNAFLPGAVATASDFPLPRKVFSKVVPDRVGGDAEERNLLFAGLSNLVTVRSDVFTVYLRIKAVKQDPVSGRWDATDPTLLVDDSRYVMVIDRSNVKKPGEQPRILAFQRVDSPN